ncbi:hypothetical protein ACUOFC_24095, partial [Escherichia sp. TWPC-MK]
NTILLEKNSFSSGSTGQSGGFIRVYHNDPYLTEIAKEGINDFFSISEAVKFKQTGMLYIENETQHIKMEKLECKSLMDLYTFAQRNKIG